MQAACRAEWTATLLAETRPTLLHVEGSGSTRTDEEPTITAVQPVHPYVHVVVVAVLRCRGGPGVARRD